MWHFFAFSQVLIWPSGRKSNPKSNRFLGRVSLPESHRCVHVWVYVYVCMRLCILCTIVLDRLALLLACQANYYFCCVSLHTFFALLDMMLWKCTVQAWSAYATLWLGCGYCCVGTRGTALIAEWTLQKAVLSIINCIEALDLEWQMFATHFLVGVYESTYEEDQGFRNSYDCLLLSRV